MCSWRFVWIFPQQRLLPVSPVVPTTATIEAKETAQLSGSVNTVDQQLKIADVARQVDGVVNIILVKDIL